MIANRKKAIITGITGYIGSNLARSLLQLGWDIGGIIPTNADTTYIADFKDQVQLSIYNEDIASITSFLQRFQPEVIFHLASYFAAEHKPNQITNLIQSNILFGTHLLEAMFQAGIKKLVNTGTSWQHYNNEEYNPVCLYAATKEAFEKIITFYVNAYNFNALTLELFDTYGPNDLRSKLIPLLFKISQTGEQLSMSPGEQEIDLVYIEDVVTAFIKAAELLFTRNITYEKFMVSTGNPKKLQEIIKVFEQTYGTKLKIIWGDKPYRTREVMHIWNKGTIIPEWHAKYTLKQGLKKLYKSNND